LLLGDERGIKITSRKSNSESNSNDEYIRNVFKETEARYIVSGTIYKQGDRLRFQPQITDMATGRIIPSQSAIVGSAAEINMLLNRLSQRIMGTIAAAYHPVLAKYSENGGYVPDYDAYLEYHQGWDLFSRRKFRPANEKFSRAAHLDSTFVLPLFFSALIHSIIGEDTKADSIIKTITLSRTKLLESEELLLDWISADSKGDLRGKSKSSRELAILFPDWDFQQYQAGLDAISVNNLNLAKKFFSKVDINSEYIKNWEFFWINYGHTLHMLGDYEKELEIEYERSSRFPESRGAIRDEIRAYMILLIYY